MNTFKFYQDKKVKVWLRTFFTIRANNYREAVEKIKARIGANIVEFAPEDDCFGIGDVEVVYESAEPISLKKNKGLSMWEVYSKETGEIVAFNGR